MATSNKAVWQTMQSHISALGYGPVVIGEPRSSMQSGTVAVIPDHGGIDEMTLSSPREVHRCILRCYRNFLDVPQEETEFKLDQFRADVQADVFGDFNLGGAIAYAIPGDFAWLYDVKKVQNIEYVTVDLLVAYRIDDASTFQP